MLVTTLGYSSLTWFEAYPSEKTEYVILGLTRALEYYNAVPYALRPDNMATCVTKHTRYELEFTDALKDFARHYEMEIHPCRVRHPKDKAACERAVLIIENEFLSRLSGKVFDSFDELNKKAAQYCHELNSRRKRGEHYSRLELYHQYDLPEMKNLPSTPFVLYEYSEKNVPKNYHVYFDKHYYSVPYTSIGQQVIIKASSYDVVICDRQNRVLAAHKRSWRKDGMNWKYVTDKNHMPPNHKKVCESHEPEGLRLLEKARNIGPATEQLVAQVIERSEFEVQAYKSCRGIIHYAETIDSQTAEQIASRCLESGCISYGSFKNAVEKMNAKTNAYQKTDGSIPEHENIRGEEEFK